MRTREGQRVLPLGPLAQALWAPSPLGPRPFGPHWVSGLPFGPQSIWNLYWSPGLHVGSLGPGPLGSICMRVMLGFQPPPLPYPVGPSPIVPSSFQWRIRQRPEKSSLVGPFAEIVIRKVCMGGTSPDSNRVGLPPPPPPAPSHKPPGGQGRLNNNDRRKRWAGSGLSEAEGRS